MEVLNTMSNYLSAFDTIKEQYDIDTLREIRDHGCSSGVAHSHIYYHQTGTFYELYNEEIEQYISDHFGDEIKVELFTDNNCYLPHYKNDLVWTYIESVANTLVEQYEDITCEEMNDSFDDILSLNDGKVHDITNAIGMNSLSKV